MEGFIHRIWRNFGVDKVGMVKKGIFVVHFKTMEKRDQIIFGAPVFFDSKPVVNRS